ncbi:DNA-binding protein [Limnohabitans sp. Rim8]|uniref:DNA-binding protein n=1 Tax=Limnohabitans sp. Rim8 TaxID=1100718 RepID=UPI0025D7D5EC|nr:DNA-binding protein [Limnohabitans sp. Rim8]
MTSTTTTRIFEIADEVDAAGHNPTLASVRKALGGGSYTTISQAMTEWRARKAAKETPVQEAAPQAITELLEQLGTDIWTQALQICNGRLSAEREALENDRQGLEAQRQEAADLADQLSSELEAARQEATDLSKQLDVAQSTVKGLGDQLRDRERDLAVAEVRADEIKTRATQLTDQLKAATAQNAQLLQTITDMQQAKNQKGK